MAKKKRKTHLSTTMKQEIKDVPLDAPSIIVLSFVGLLVLTYLCFAVMTFYGMVVSHE